MLTLADDVCKQKWLTIVTRLTLFPAQFTQQCEREKSASNTTYNQSATLSDTCQTQALGQTAGLLISSFALVQALLVFIILMEINSFDIISSTVHTTV